MAKEHVSEKLRELRALNAEAIMCENISTIKYQKNTTFKVVLNVLDDLKGGWTNRFTSDYQSKFKLSGFLSRNFIVPVFWSSEHYSKELIQERTLEYCYRSIYWLEHNKPITLRDHLLQEKFVCDRVNGSLNKLNVAHLMNLYLEHKDSIDPVLISCFFW